MRDEKISMGGKTFQVAEITDLNYFHRDFVEDFRRTFRGNGCHNLGTQANEERSELIELVRLGCDRNLLASRVEMSVQEGILQLCAAPADFRWRGPTGNRGK